MITPAYAPTATERVLPRLALDFTTATLDPRVTVTRALNTATVRNANGSISIVNADLPRFDYLNGVCRGLLIEETRTNLLSNSVFSGAVAGTPGTAPTGWLDLVATGTIASVSAGIYAAGNAIRITTSGTRRSFYKVQALSANTTYSYSLTVTVNSTPVAGYPRIQDCMFLANGPAGSTVTYLLNGAAATAGTAIPNGQTSTIVAIIAVGATAGNVEVRWGLSVTSTVDGDVTIQMPQLEAGAFATSYIPTTTTSLTRNADVVSMTGTNFSNWYNADEGAFVVEASTPPSGTYAPIIQVDSGTANNRIVVGQTAGGFADYSVVSSGSAQASFQTTTIANSTASIAGVYKTDSFARAVNGEAASTDNLGLVPTVNNLKIGSNLTPVYFNRHIRKIRFYSQRILNAEATAFSKL